MNSSHRQLGEGFETLLHGLQAGRLGSVWRAEFGDVRPCNEGAPRADDDYGRDVA